MSIEFEKIERIVLLFWDEKENFHLNKTQQKIGKLFQDVCQIDGLESFNKAISQYPDSKQQFLCLVHLGHLKENKGYDDFINSKILKDYPNLRYYLITSALRNEVYNKNKQNEALDVYTYDRYQEKIFTTFIPQTKAEIVDKTKKAFETTDSLLQNNPPNCDYAIITALEEDEMEKVLPMITRVDRIPNDKHLIEYGHLTSNPEKKIAYASQQATGMIDAAILATELILQFRPKFLIMAGVLGGKPDDVKIGDVIIATKVFTIHKGKINEYGFKRELEASNNESAYITLLRRNKSDIVQYLRKKDETRNSKIDIHFGPVACVGQVIDLEDFFKDNITPVDRKTLALEMESYGVSRACELVNDGKTKALIIKSAMDTTQGKGDKEKPYAAWTSARFVQYILENDLI